MHVWSSVQPVRQSCADRVPAIVVERDKCAPLRDRERELRIALDLISAMRPVNVDKIEFANHEIEQRVRQKNLRARLQDANFVAPLRCILDKARQVIGKRSRGSFADTGKSTFSQNGSTQTMTLSSMRAKCFPGASSSCALHSSRFPER